MDPARGALLISNLADNVSPLHFDRAEHKAAFVAYLGISGGLPDTGAVTITTLGTVATGTWQAGVIAGQFGGTGVANTGKTLTLGGNLATSGAYACTLTLTGATTVTLPTTGTLATQSYVTSQLTSVQDTLQASIDGKTSPSDVASAVTAGIAEKAPLASPTFTGTTNFPGGAYIDDTGTVVGNYIASAGGFAAGQGALNFIPSGGGWLLTLTAPLVCPSITLPPVALTYSDPLSLDFLGAANQLLTLTGDITFTTTNLAAGKAIAITITAASGGPCAFTFPAGWTFLGSDAPTSIADGKRAVLRLTSLGTADSDVIATYSVQPSGGDVPQIPFILQIACSDLTTDITTGASKAVFRMPAGMIISAVRASASAAPSGSEIFIDINASGTSILSTRLSIDATETTSTTAAAPAVIGGSLIGNEILDDAEITIDFDQVGSGDPGRGVIVTLIGTYA